MEGRRKVTYPELYVFGADYKEEIPSIYGGREELFKSFLKNRDFLIVDSLVSNVDTYLSGFSCFSSSFLLAEMMSSSLSIV